MKRSKPYTKGGGKPYTERYMEAFKTLHERWGKPYTERYMEAFKTLHKTAHKPCTATARSLLRSAPK